MYWIVVYIYFEYSSFIVSKLVISLYFSELILLMHAMIILILIDVLEFFIKFYRLR